VKRKRTVYGEHYRQALQRRVHQLPGFEASILEARERLGYDVAWWPPDDDAPRPGDDDPWWLFGGDLALVGAGTASPYWEFVKAHWREVEAAAEAALTRLGLPSGRHLDRQAQLHFSLLGYWMAAFYSFRPGDLASVETFAMPGRANIVRAYPTLVDTAVWLTADRVHIVALRNLVTREDLYRAADLAWAAAKRDRGPAHPLARARRALPGVATREEATADRDREILRLRSKGLSQEQIAAEFLPSEDAKLLAHADAKLRASDDATFLASEAARRRRRNMVNKVRRVSHRHGMRGPVR
jgi:hypothetical protein